VKPRLAEIERWTDTMTEEQIARCCGVAPCSFIEYKKKYPELVEALKSGIEKLVKELRSTLLKRARGFSYTEEKEIIFEPDGKSLIDNLVELYLDNTVRAVVLEAKTGEHSARMTAMTAASDNTEQLLAKLNLELNHARQSAITTEISEIVGGANALQSSEEGKRG
jgi:F-type H+-transporting ATPase subunit gamma